MDEQEQDREHPANHIPEERALEQQSIPFLDDELAAAMAAGGSIYISLAGMCGALGLNTQAQMRRIQRTRTLSKGLRLIPLKTKGGSQRVNCLRVDLVALWLAGVQTGSIKEEYRAKIEAYQDELAPVATQVFLRMAGMSLAQVVPNTDPQVVTLAEQIDTLTDVATFLREHMQSLLGTTEQIASIAPQLGQAVQLLEHFIEKQEITEQRVDKIDERTQQLTPAHKREVQSFVDRMVRQTKTAAMPLTYAIIYGRLKHRFRVGSYAEIADEKHQDVMEYLRDELRKAAGGQAPEQGQLF